MAGYNSCVFSYGQVYPYDLCFCCTYHVELYPYASTFNRLQTGSGKTHTMLGEISELGVNPGPECGMIPRIFELLIARIREVYIFFISVDSR
jgi:hypothetical protein